MNRLRNSFQISLILGTLLFANIGYSQQEQISSPGSDTSTPNGDAAAKNNQAPAENNQAPVENNENPGQQTQASAPRPLLDKQHLINQKAEHLAREIDPELLLWLGEGDDRFLSVYHQAWRPLADGAAIILHDDGQHPRWPHTSKILSDSLAKHGWTTLSISLPPSLSAKVPKRPPAAIATQGDNPETDEQTPASGDPENEPNQAKELGQTEEQTATNSGDSARASNDITGQQSPENSQEIDAELLDPESQAFDRLMLAYEYLRQQGLLNIAIICEGKSLVRATKMISAIPLPPPSNPQAKVAKPIAALIGIAADHKTPQGESFNVAKSIAELDLYVMDIYFDDSEESQKMAARRKAEAQRAGLAVYRQQRLPLSSGKLSQGENSLSKRVRGFLNRYAKGRAKKLP